MLEPKSYSQGWENRNLSETIVVGIDIAKHTLDAAFGVASRIETFANDDIGHDALLAKLAGQAVMLIVREATGGLEQDRVCLLQASGFTVTVVNPRQARDFAKAMGLLAKSRVHAQAADPPQRHR